MMPSRTMEAIVRCVQQAEQAGHSISWHFAHGQKLPDAYNDTLKAALTDSTDYVWFVDDDMGFSPSTLVDSVDTGGDMVVINYPVTAEGGHAVQHKAGYTIGGFGSVLVSKAALSAVQLSDGTYLRTNVAYQGGELTQVQTSINDRRHGGHDVDFYIRVQDAGYTVTVLPIIGTQYKVIELNNRKGNNMPDTIEEWTI